MIALLPDLRLYFSAVLWFLWIGALYRFSAKLPLRGHFFPALALKIVGGLCVGWVYAQYLAAGKGADTFGFFRDGCYLADLALKNPTIYLEFFFSGKGEIQDLVTAGLSIKNPRAVLFSKWVSLFVLLAGKHYLAVGLYFSLLSFTAIWWLSNLLARYFPALRLLLPAAFFYFPSTLFWTSGILKEALLMASICTLLALFLKIAKQRPVLPLKIIYLLLVVFISYNILILKYYYFAALLPSLLALYFSENSKRYKIFVFGLVYLFSLLLGSFSHPNLRPRKILGAVVKNNQIMTGQTENSTNLIHYPNLRPSVGSFVRHTPKAILEGWLRPYLWESGNRLKKIASVESFCLFWLTLFSLLPPYRRCSPTAFPPLFRLSILLFCLLLLLMLSLSAPNLGNLIRYKSVFMPFALLLILFEIQQKYFR